MNRICMLAALSLAIFTTSTVDAWAQGPKTGSKEKKKLYLVIAIDGNFEVIEKSSLKSRKKSLDESHASAVKSWEERKKTARKEKTKFKEPKPKKPKLKTHGGTHKRESAARLAMEKLVAKAEKKKSKKRGRGGDKNS